MNNENDAECSHFSDNIRPKKRQRMMPDGFSTSNTQSKQIQSIPQFSSAFEERTTTPKKLISKSHCLPLDTRSTNSLHPPVQPVKRPVFSTARPPNTAPLDERRVPLTTLPYIQKTIDPPSALKCIPIPTPPKSRMTSNIKPLVRPHPPPLTAVISKQLNTNLKHLPLPVFLAVPQAQPVKDMRTINTTEIALATDLSTESGTAELASIFLHDRSAPHPLSVVQEYKGLLSSQEPDSKKGVKFCRNGLAACASDLFNRSRTALFLWEKQSESVRRNNNDYELKMRITRIIHAPTEHLPGGQRNLSMPLGIALCELLSSSHDYSSWSQKRPYQVAFSFKATSNIKKVASFVEGSTVYIWKPLQMTSLSTSCTSLSPSTLPLPSPIALTASNMVDLPVNDISYICSRFVIFP